MRKSQVTGVIFLLIMGFLSVSSILRIQPALSMNDPPDRTDSQTGLRTVPVSVAYRGVRTSESVTPMEESHGLGPPSAGGKFTICILTYKAPKSLQYTLQSLVKYGLLAHPDLLEVIVYFQVFRRVHDTAVVEEALRSTRARFRVIGSPDNLPVAKATFALIRSVVTPYVLYLECDRPILGRSPDDAVTRHVVRNRIDAGLKFLREGSANIVRMQLYASSDLRDSDLRVDTYGVVSTVPACAAAPSLSKDECLQSKKSKGHTFYTAYCKHWWKFKSEIENVDMCDSFCFMEWMSKESITKGAAKHKAVRAVTHITTEGGQETMYCLPSYLCNWTNQPTLYSVQWYAKAVIGPCEADPVGCFGKPGRGSAVRQEVFLTRKRVWGTRNHTVCVSRGLFSHHEIDNREASAPKF